MEGVWTLTKLCLAWNKQETDDLRLKKPLLEFNAAEVEYLIVGAHALAAYGHVRATKDLDIWIRPRPENARKVLVALQSFGAPLLDLSENDLSRDGLIFQIGIAPLRIDLMTSIDGVNFDEAWPERVKTNFLEVPSFVISKRHLIANKKATARLQDRADVEHLEGSA
jgi:hypothetical protein